VLSSVVPAGREVAASAEPSFSRLTWGNTGGPPGARTPHQKLKRLLLYQMS
jgi:hypothetical protein